MRRPQGFDRPAPPRKLDAPARPKRPGTPTSADEANGANDAPTEPIQIQSQGPATVAPVSPLWRPSGAPTLTPAKARTQLRTAKRARKQYEREEVRRFTWRSRRRRTTWLVSLGTAATLIGIVIVGAYSPLMALRTIEVIGTNRVPADQVLAALGDQLGTPLPLIDFSRVKSKLSEFTLIRSYATESRPPGTLVVRVVEREPVGVIPSNAGFDLVDAAGVVMQSGAEPPAGFPAINTPGGIGSAGFAAAAAVVDALPEGIRSQLVTVTAATNDDVTLTLVGGALVVWGSAENSEYKAVVLSALMVSHPVGSVTEYDVSSPDSAVLR